MYIYVFVHQFRDKVPAYVLVDNWGTLAMERHQEVKW